MPVKILGLRELHIKDGSIVDLRVSLDGKVAGSKGIGRDGNHATMEALNNIEMGKNIRIGPFFLYEGDNVVLTVFAGEPGYLMNRAYRGVGIAQNPHEAIVHAMML